MKNLNKCLLQHQKTLLKYSMFILHMCSIESKIATIYSLKDIEEKAQNNPYLVLFAYKKESYNNAKDRHLKQTIDRIENSLEKLANRKEYLMTGVRFAKTKADTSFWQHLMEKVGTDQTEETMCFIIFEEGIIIKKNNLPACLLGKHGLVDIKEFIENYLGDQIAQTMKNMNAEKQKYQEKQEEDYADDRSSTSINVYYPSYYDPYYYHWGYPWYSYGPGWGYGRWRGYRSHHHHGWHGRGSRHRR